MKKTYSKEEVEKIKEAFLEEIKRKEKTIEELKKNNLLLLKTALKKAENKIKEEEINKNKLKNSNE